MENISFKHILADHAKHFPDKRAVIFNHQERFTEDKILTYREFNSRCCRLANGLLELGFSRGDHITMLSMNNSDYAELYWGLPKAGFVLVPINFRFVGDEILYIVNHSDTKAIIFEQQYLNTINSIRSKFEKVKDNGYIIIGDHTPKGMTNYKELLARSPDTEPDIEVKETEPSLLVYTSGTTARPKGVVKTEGSLIWFIIQVAYHYHWHPDVVTIISTPHYHLGGEIMTHAPLYLGGTVIVQRQFEPVDWLELVAKYKADSFWLIPTALNQVVNLPDEVLTKYDLSSVGDIMSSGAPLHAETWDKARKLFPNGKIHNFYCSTEHGGSTILFQDDKDQANRPAECIGLPALGARVKIGDSQGNELPCGQLGEIWVKVASNATEYYKNPEANEEGFKNGWLSVGDMGRQDEEGYYYIIDRKKDMIITGGENVSPRDVEEIIYRHPKVLEAAVLGVPDDKWGEAIRAVIVPKPGEKATQEEVIQFCRGKIASYKIPKSADFVDSLPKTPTGKILKKDIRQALLEGYEKRLHQPGDFR